MNKQPEYIELTVKIPVTDDWIDWESEEERDWLKKALLEAYLIRLGNDFDDWVDCKALVVGMYNYD